MTPSLGVWMLIPEACLAVIVLLLSLAIPAFGEGVAERIERWGKEFSKQRARAVLLVGISAPLIRLALLPLAPIPQPSVHDEFSHLLAGETFSSGRLTNPTHPMWVHLETFHVNYHPTYMSMYPPAQGLILGFGRILFGHPWYGVCLSVGFMCGAICWMLQGWFSPGWALLGGIIAVLRIGIFSYWMDSYWGGAISAAGGALVLGALPRLIGRPRRSMALVLALGLAILANSRPYEGLLLSAPVAGTLLVWATGRNRPPLRLLLMQVVTPVSIVLMLTGGAMAYYNWRVFGSPFTPPYRINRTTYAVSPVFLWQSPGPEPPYRHSIIRDFYVNQELGAFQSARTVRGFAAATATKIGTVLLFFFGAVPMIALLMLPRVCRDRQAAFFLWSGLVYFIGVSANAFNTPHYFAPAASLLYGMLLYCMRQIREWRPGGQRTGVFLFNAIPVVCVLLCVMHTASSTVSRTRIDRPRTQVQRLLEGLPGRHLAIVRYTGEHDPKDEWVYNAADIDSAKVVWAREMTASMDKELIAYFKDRKVWLVQPDTKGPALVPYEF